MKSFFFRKRRNDQQSGFSLVEASLALGLMSCGFLTLAPLLALGLKTARLARDDRATAQIAQTLTEKVRQGALPAQGTVNLDFEGNPAAAAAEAVYQVQLTEQTLPENGTLDRLTLRVTPLGAPDRVQTYAIVLPAPEKF